MRWTCKSTTRLAAELVRQGHPASQRTVCDLCAQLDYSPQSTRKTRGGTQHPDRDAQFLHIARWVAQFQAARQPVISVDTKKKELIGDFANRGREWRPKAQPETVRVHDFADPELGKVVPYGVYDLSANTGWVSVGIDHDTAEHRMFCHITQNWRGRALVSRQVVVNLIGQTTTAQGLRIQAKLDTGKYQPGIKVTDDQLATVALEPDAFHGEWNYTIKPKR